MRILLIHNYYQITGGEDIYVDSVHTLLKQKGHEVYLYAKNSKHIQENFSGKVRIGVNMIFGQDTTNEVQSIISSFKPQVAHINNIYPLITPVIRDICHHQRIPIVETVHTYRPLCPKGNLFRNNQVCQLCVDKRFQYPSIIYGCYHDSKVASAIFATSSLSHNPKKQLSQVNKLIFPSKFMATYFQNALILRRNQIRVLNHFVSKNEPKALQVDSPAPQKYYLFVGRLFPEKGIIPLLQTISKLSNINLVVIGNGPLYQEVSSYARYPNIFIKGEVNNNQLSYYYQNATATIIPSLGIYEVGPLVLLESYSYGTPVITSDFELFQERVIDESTGFLYPSNALHKLQKLLIAPDTEAKLLKMRPSVLIEYKKKYTPDIYYKGLVNIYNELINETDFKS